MIESFTNSQTTTVPQTKRVLTMVKNERMGGFVPKYEIIKVSNTDIAQNIEDSLSGSQGLDTLAYQATDEKLSQEDQFTFGDLIDIVNPLHHVPVIGHLYRELTGDTIKPIGKIMGGAVFSGPIGVATALVDNVVTHETGKDMASNAFDIALGRTKEPITPNTTHQTPESVIETAINTANDPQMTAALLAFSDLGNKDDATLRFEAYQRVEDTMKAPAKEREPITRISFSQRNSLYNS